MIPELLTLLLATERDVVVARQRTRQITMLLGFDAQDQTRAATAVSEIARNAVRYARDGRVEFRIEGSTSPQVLMVRVSDRGPGIGDLEHVLSGDYRSSTGMGIGILGSRRLMDGFEARTSPAGTTIVLKKLLPRGAPLVTPAVAARLVAELARQEPRDVFEEVRRQNQELLRALDDLRQRQDELLRLNRELEDTNRGVLALYAELDEKADHLRRADELKTRFLSNMTHEFRTPLSSVLALSRLLLDRVDGPLSSEQERQVELIRAGAGELLELVNDLLDLAKVQAGKTVVRSAEFRVQDLFGALRGMLRPLLVGERVELVIEAAEDLAPLTSDEGKVSQILRNLISNALKFTEKGEVRVGARVSDDGRRMLFAVSDTGIGIAADDQVSIFEEFGQVDHPIQKRVRGTGLGLPLSRRLAGLLGGTLEVESRLGFGSTFTLSIPRFVVAVPDPSGDPALDARGPKEFEIDPLRVPVLLVEDDPAEQLVMQTLSRDTRFQVVCAATTREARDWLERITPAVVVLDIMLAGEDTWDLLAELKSGDPRTSPPTLVMTWVDDERKARALGADGYCAKPLRHDFVLAELERLSSQDARQTSGAVRTGVTAG
jgi:signal transduction histidine kinase/ActR/RegA family two-component response regulator